jgi:hypothetical protein
MTESEPTEAVRAANGTALDRLGSEKALLALTDARLETPAVLEATGAVLATARATLADWAADGEAEVAAALGEAADTLADATDRIADSLGTDLPGDSPFLSLEGTTAEERAGAGLIGVGLVLDRLCLQGVSFFVNEADETRADLFRELRADAEHLLGLAEGLDLGEAAVGAAGAVVEAAYEEYVTRLEEMGFDPKPIC